MQFMRIGIDKAALILVAVINSVAKLIEVIKRKDQKGGMLVAESRKGKPNTAKGSNMPKGPKKKKKIAQSPKKGRQKGVIFKWLLNAKVERKRVVRKVNKFVKTLYKND